MAGIRRTETSTQAGEIPSKMRGDVSREFLNNVEVAQSIANPIFEHSCPSFGRYLSAMQELGLKSVGKHVSKEMPHNGKRVNKLRNKIR